MKLKLLIMILTIVPIVSFSQSVEDTTLVKYYKVNFAVPDLPAFNVLGNSPSDILRPTDVKGLSVIASEFYNGSTIVLPKSFSMEIAPFLLAKNNSLTLEDYDKNKWLYNFRISIGTATNEINNISYTDMAVGARFTIIDDGDLKNDKKYRADLWDRLAREVADDNVYKKEFAKTHDKTIQEIIQDDKLNKQMEDYVKEKKGEFYTKELKKVKKDYKYKNWNKQKLELAYAFLGSSPDSLVKNIESKKHSLWLTYANPLKTDWGQLLIGLNYSYNFADSINIENSETVKYEFSTFSLASRFYFGSNRIKGFLEGQYKFIEDNSKNNVLLNLGSEINLRDGIWLVLNVGVDWDDLSSNSIKSGFYSGFNLRFSIPENFSMN